MSANEAKAAASSSSSSSVVCAYLVVFRQALRVGYCHRAPQAVPRLLQHALRHHHLRPTRASAMLAPAAVLGTNTLRVAKSLMLHAARASVTWRKLTESRFVCLGAVCLPLDDVSDAGLRSFTAAFALSRSDKSNRTVAVVAQGGDVVQLYCCGGCGRGAHLRVLHVVRPSPRRSFARDALLVPDQRVTHFFSA